MHKSDTQEDKLWMLDNAMIETVKETCETITTHNCRWNLRFGALWENYYILCLHRTSRFFFWSYQEDPSIYAALVVFTDPVQRHYELRKQNPQRLKLFSSRLSINLKGTRMPLLQPSIARKSYLQWGADLVILENGLPSKIRLPKPEGEGRTSHVAFDGNLQPGSHALRCSPSR
jgi:hypothetical protein